MSCLRFCVDPCNLINIYQLLYLIIWLNIGILCPPPWYCCWGGKIQRWLHVLQSASRHHLHRVTQSSHSSHCCVSSSPSVCAAAQTFDFNRWFEAAGKWFNDLCGWVWSIFNQALMWTTWSQTCPWSVCPHSVGDVVEVIFTLQQSSTLNSNPAIIKHNTHTQSRTAVVLLLI